MNDIITPITDLFPMDQYDLESVIQKEGMLQINFIGKRYRILVDYEYLYIIYRSSDEGDRLKSLYYYLEDKEKDYFTKNLMYAVKESDFINWMVEEKFGFYSKETIFHHMYVTSEDIIDVLARDMPKIEVETITECVEVFL